MYVVGWFHQHGKDGDVFPNAFPDFDMAQDCVIHEIKHHSGDVIDDLIPLTNSVGGKSLYYHGEYFYVIRKMFNFDPRGH